MSRCNADWLNAYVKLLNYTEAPALNHFWAGVGAIAGALRRRVWIDHETFKWYASFFIIFVAPPEVISKSVTAGVAMDMLGEIPGVHFGPDSITWQSLVTSFAGCGESFELNGSWYPMSALTFFSSELGLLLDFRDTGMINVLIDLWDGRKKFEKKTKMSGDDMIEAPFISILACTTPDWIAASIPAVAVGGGFTSRCVFVYADKKERLIAHPKKHVPADFQPRRQSLLADLERISTLAGEFKFTDAAVEWEEEWYDHLWTVERAQADSNQTKALQRRHTHLNKLAMILSVSRSDSLCIDVEDFELADVMLRDTAVHYDKVFSRIGLSEASMQTEILLDFIRKKGGTVPFSEAYRQVHLSFPNYHDWEGVFMGLTQSGKLMSDGVNLRIP